MENQYQPAPFKLRFGAFIIDTLIVFFIWYLFTVKDMESINTLLETLEPEAEGALDLFSGAVLKLYTAFIFKYIFIQLLVYTIFPAIIGGGKTLGKFLFGISTVGIEDLEEISASRLILREFAARCLLETLLVIPFIISFFMAVFRKDSRSLHDIIARTAVVKKSVSQENYKF